MPDEFASVTRNDALLDVIRDEITRQGPIPFARFMELALYTPGLGYYRSDARRIGQRGDYLTSPSLGPLFGGIIGRQVAELWERLGAPDAFDLVEMGADDARLMRDVLAWAARAHAPLAAALRPLLVEPDAAMADRQRRTLARAAVAPRWVASLHDLPIASVVGCVLSNELVDSFPVRVFVVRAGAAREVVVGLRGAALVELEAPVAEPAPEALAAVVARLPEGARFEVGEAAAAWMQAVARILARGFVLTFDYGYAAATLYAPWRTAGTLMAFYRHTVSTDPLAHVGEQDLTAHVDFTALAAAGAVGGLEPVGFTGQREFLSALGIHQAVSVPGLTFEEVLARRRAVLALTDPAGLGRVRVLAQARGVDGTALGGFVGSPPPRDALISDEPWPMPRRTDE